MRKELIENYFKQNSWEIGNGVRVSDILWSKTQRRFIDLRTIRESRLADRSDWEKNFEDYIEGTGEPWIREMIFPIQDYSRWNRILDGYGIPKGSTERKRTYFQSDFLLPKSGIIVEIDSSFHDTRRREDLARDLYLQLDYGIQTLRFRSFDKKISGTKAIEDQIRYRSGLFEASSYIPWTAVAWSIEKLESDSLRCLTELEGFLGVSELKSNLYLTGLDLRNLGWLDNQGKPEKWVFRFFKFISRYAAVDIYADMEITKYGHPDILAAHRVSQRRISLPAAEMERIGSILERLELP